MAPRLGLLFQLCKMATTKLSGQLDKLRESVAGRRLGGEVKKRSDRLPQTAEEPGNSGANCCGRTRPASSSKMTDTNQSPAAPSQGADT